MRNFKESSKEDFSSEITVDTPIKYWVDVKRRQNTVFCVVGSDQLFGEDDCNEAAVEYVNDGYKHAITGDKLSYEEASDLTKVISMNGWDGPIDEEDLEVVIKHPTFKTACKTWKKFIDKLKNGGDKVESSIISKISQALKD